MPIFLRIVTNFSILIATLAITLPNARAGDLIRLWDAKGEAVTSYGAMVTSIPPGAEIVLREGPPLETAKIVKFLGNGSTTVVYEIEGGRAIRLARGAELSPFGPAYSAYLTWFDMGMQKLENTTIPIPKVFRPETLNSRFVIVETLIPPSDVPEMYSLWDLTHGKIKDEELASRMTRALIEDFAPLTWPVRMVSDMKSSQVIFTSRGWVLADVSSSVRMAKTVRDATLFSAMSGLPASWKLKLEKSVFRAREQAELTGNFAQFLMGEVRRCLGWLKGAVMDGR